ncbi:hypothetical protein IE4803_CH00538 [Rhizobium etli bv. phaseoli str. IE4803]|nr:hypothetical protein IE4803_CH00538 [Rhizobium etli bv. phaseoli str. IE4803]
MTAPSPRSAISSLNVRLGLDRFVLRLKAITARFRYLSMAFGEAEIGLIGKARRLSASIKQR